MVQIWRKFLREWRGWRKDPHHTFVDSLGHPTHTSGVLTTLEQGYTDSYIKSYLVSSFELPANN